jgi:hypothetical protein
MTTSRRMLYLQSSEKAAVTVPSYLLASLALVINQRSNTYDGALNQPDGPFTLEILANGAPPLNPLVCVVCNDTTSSVFDRDFTYELDPFDPTSDYEKTNGWTELQTSTFDIRSIWSERELRNSVNGTQLRWKDMTNATTAPMLLAFLRHGINVSVCVVQSHWKSTSQWVLSTSNFGVATNSRSTT